MTSPVELQTATQETEEAQPLKDTESHAPNVTSAFDDVVDMLYPESVDTKETHEHSASATKSCSNCKCNSKITCAVLIMLLVFLSFAFAGCALVWAGLQETQYYATSFTIAGRCQLIDVDDGCVSPCHSESHDCCYPDQTWRIHDTLNGSMPCQVGTEFVIDGETKKTPGSLADCYTNPTCDEVFTSRPKSGDFHDYHGLSIMPFMFSLATLGALIYFLCQSTEGKLERIDDCKKTCCGSCCGSTS